MGVIKTFYLDVMEYCNNVGLNYEVQNIDLTLDESLNKYNYYAGKNPFKLQYYSLGYTNNSNEVEPPISMIKSKHGALDYKIQNIVPFRYRSIENDLSIQEQQNYRMKVLSQDGQYWLYYLKKFDIEILQPCLFDIENLKGLCQSISPINFYELQYYKNSEGLANFQFLLTITKDEINEINQYLKTIPSKNPLPYLNTVAICIGQDDGSEAHNVQVGYFSNTTIPLVNEIETTYKIDIGRFGTL